MVIVCTELSSDGIYLEHRSAVVLGSLGSSEVISIVGRVGLPDFVWAELADFFGITGRISKPG